MGEVTEVLNAARQGCALDIGRLFELLHPELKRIARSRLRYRDDRLMIDTHVLVNECYLRLLGSDKLAALNRGHFLAYAARVMRSVVVDIARERNAQCRGGDLHFDPLDTAAHNVWRTQGDEEIVRVHEALDALERIDDRVARVVEMRYFGGFDNNEIAHSLGVTTRTVERDWEKARTYLHHVLRQH